MMSIVPRWKVVVTLPSREIVLWIDDAHFNSVLRMVAALNFSDTGLEQPRQVVVILTGTLDGDPPRVQLVSPITPRG